MTKVPGINCEAEVCMVDMEKTLKPRKPLSTQFVRILGAGVTVLAVLSHADLAFALDGSASGGGANFVGTELFDDIENSGTDPLPDFEKLVEPGLRALAKKLPGFAFRLRDGLKGTRWLLEPKPLVQGGSCFNQSALSVDRKVRVCQSKLSVRFDKDFFDLHPELYEKTILHELLVYRQLKLNDQHPNQVIDEGVREVSHAIRLGNESPEELREIVKRAGFGDYKVAESSVITQAQKIVDFINNEQATQGLHAIQSGALSTKLCLVHASLSARESKMYFEFTQQSTAGQERYVSFLLVDGDNEIAQSFDGETERTKSISVQSKQENSAINLEFFSDRIKRLSWTIHGKYYSLNGESYSCELPSEDKKAILGPELPFEQRVLNVKAGQKLDVPHATDVLVGEFSNSCRTWGGSVTIDKVTDDAIYFISPPLFGTYSNATCARGPVRIPFKLIHERIQHSSELAAKFQVAQDILSSKQPKTCRFYGQDFVVGKSYSIPSLRTELNTEGDMVIGGARIIGSPCYLDSGSKVEIVGCDADGANMIGRFRLLSQPKHIDTSRYVHYPETCGNNETFFISPRVGKALQFKHGLLGFLGYGAEP